jgi:hypothetical protein
MFLFKPFFVIDTFTKLQRTTAASSFPSLHMKQLCTPRMLVLEFVGLSVFLNVSRKWKVHLSQTTITGIIHNNLFTFTVSCSDVPWEGVLRCSNLPSRNSEVLTKMSRIPSSMENTSVTM